MHPADIKAAIEKAGSSQSEIARSLSGARRASITPGAVYMVIKGLSKSNRVARRISAITGLPVSQLWPGKYPDIEKLERLAVSRAAPAPGRASKRASVKPARASANDKNFDGKAE